MSIFWWLRVWARETRWFPYRTYEFLGVDDNGDARFGRAVWHRPRGWKKP